MDILNLEDYEPQLKYRRYGYLVYLNTQNGHNKYYIFQFLKHKKIPMMGYYGAIGSVPRYVPISTMQDFRKKLIDKLSKGYEEILENMTMWKLAGIDRILDKVDE